MPFSRQLIVLSAVWLLTGSPGSGAPALATSPSLTFFSTLAEEPFARLEAATITPRYTRHGPFRLPAPGVEIESPTLILHDQPCTAEDWQRVLEGLATWRRMPASTAFVLTAPDGRAFVFLRPPSLSGGVLSGIVRRLDAPSDATDQRGPAMLRLGHDGGTALRLDLRQLPATPSRDQTATPSAEPDNTSETATPYPLPAS